MQVFKLHVEGFSIQKAALYHVTYEQYTEELTKGTRPKIEASQSTLVINVRVWKTRRDENYNKKTISKRTAENFLSLPKLWSSARTKPSFCAIAKETVIKRKMRALWPNTCLTFAELCQQLAQHQPGVQAVYQVHWTSSSQTTCCPRHRVTCRNVSNGKTSVNSLLCRSRDTTPKQFGKLTSSCIGSHTLWTSKSLAAPWGWPRFKAETRSSEHNKYKIVE